MCEPNNPFPGELHVFYIVLNCVADQVSLINGLNFFAYEKPITPIHQGDSHRSVCASGSRIWCLTEKPPRNYKIEEFLQHNKDRRAH